MKESSLAGHEQRIRKRVLEARRPVRQAAFLARRKAYSLVLRMRLDADQEFWEMTDDGIGGQRPPNMNTVYQRQVYRNLR